MKHLLIVISLLILNDCEAQEKRPKYINAEAVFIDKIPLTKFENFFFVKDSLKHVFDTNLTLDTGEFNDEDADFADAYRYVDIMLNGLSVLFYFEKDNSHAFLINVKITNTNYPVVYNKKEIRIGDSYEKLKTLFPEYFKSFIAKYKEEEILKRKDLVLGITTYDPSVNHPYWMNLNFGVEKGKIAWISLIGE